MNKLKTILLTMFLILMTVSIAAAQATPTNGMMSILPVDLRVMTFNIWRGGELVDFGKIVEAIQTAQADVVGIQEGEGNVKRLAQALGWQHISERQQIISKYPLIDPPNSDGKYLFIQTYPGQVVAMVNVHLPSDPYGPYLVRDGMTLEDVLQNEQNTRVSAIEPLLPILRDLIEQGFPVLLTGDFNTPSYRDWTEAVMATRPEMKLLVEWPVSKLVEAVGFQDSYRVIYPDPAARPGNTWTYGYPYPRLSADEVIDRIDFVYVSNNAEVTSSQIVGPAGSPDVDLPIQPYGSDHRGVVSTVHVTPVIPPLLVSTIERRIEQGDPVVVQYHAPNGEASDRIMIVPAGGTVEQVLLWQPPYEASFAGTVTFYTGILTPGAYDVLLVDGDNTEISRSPFWVVERGALPTLTLDKTEYAAGEPITVSWVNGMTRRWDWLAIYAAGESDLHNGYYAYVYTKASVTGEVVFDSSLIGEDMLPAGDYEVRLMLDDGYSPITSVKFTVK